MRINLSRLAALSALALCAGCGNMPGPQPTSQAPVLESRSMTGEASDPRNRARIHTELAALYYGQGNMAIALEELRTATGADPSYATAHSMFGLVYAELRENQLAQISFQRALQLAPTDPDINHNYGSFLCQTRREDESIQFFLAAIRNPLYATPWKSYSTAGLCSLRAGKLQDAEELLQRALRLEPEEPVALLQMGQIRYRQQKYGEARGFVSRYNKGQDPSAESLWLALRIERQLGERLAETAYATQLRRRFPGSREYQALQRGEYE
jgi:type IV pilus assembly protein PilF